MRRIYLEENQSKKRRVAAPPMRIDRVPPKSCMFDKNRSDIIMSETFCLPERRLIRQLAEDLKKKSTNAEMEETQLITNSDIYEEKENTLKL